MNITVHTWQGLKLPKRAERNTNRARNPPDFFSRCYSLKDCYGEPDDGIEVARKTAVAEDKFQVALEVPALD